MLYNRAKEHSDTAAIFLLKGRRPEKYADRRFNGLMDRNAQGIEYTNTERAVRLINMLAEVIENKETDPDVMKQIEALNIIDIEPE